jgi:hypothetical protein
MLTTKTTSPRTCTRSRTATSSGRVRA